MWASKSLKRITDMPDIQHVVVLMLENRSFDCMLGRLYPNDPGYKGLTLNEFNTYAGTGFGVWNDTTLTAMSACIPDPDPGELFTDVNLQLFGAAGRSASPPTMCGFAQSYATQSKDGTYHPSAVMHYFTPAQVPAISTLAQAFGVCDEWFASAPCQTWPNRFFVHTGTALGHVDNDTFPIPFAAPSLFGRLDDQNKTWRVYFHDMPQSLLLKDIWVKAALHYRFFQQFLADAHDGSLPNYSFIEPRYFTDLFLNAIPNDQHPPHDVVYGEQLIATVYNALRSSPCWKQTLFIITYDEHGGCYDHIPPPAATPPDGIVANSHDFNFNAFGVRVPAVVVSPYIPPGSRIRASIGTDGSRTPFDHTSIIKTVRELFALGPRLTARDEAAPSLLSALALPVPSNDGPPSIDLPLIPPMSAQLVSTRAAAPPNGMQASLASAATSLPARPPASAEEIPEPATPRLAAHATVALAAASAIARTNAFLGIRDPISTANVGSH
jgi:phospholipase C